MPTTSTGSIKAAGIPVVYDRRAASYRVSEPFDDLPAFQVKGTEWAAFLVAQYALDALGNVVTVTAGLNRTCWH